jgi:hypothetical protein
MKRQLSHLLLGMVCGAVITAPAIASSHREAPGILKYPQVDGTDFYMFNSYETGRENYVTFIANYVPVHASYGGPNYFPLDPSALYEIHIDNDGDAEEDITFAFRPFDSFAIKTLPIGSGMNAVTNSAVLKNIGGLSGIGGDNEAGLSHAQSYKLNIVTGDRRDGTSQAVAQMNGGSEDFRIPFDYSGQKTFGGPGGYDTYADQFIFNINIPGCDSSDNGRVFVGQRYEAFKLALGEIFDLVNFAPIDGDVELTPLGAGVFFPGGVTQDPNRNALIRNNVTSFALEVHKDCLGVTTDNPIIGAWTTASMRQATVLNPNPEIETVEATGGAWTQVSRLSNPLVNELVIGYDQKDAFNRSEPVNDVQFAAFVTNPVLPRILDILFNTAVNDFLATIDPDLNIPDLAPSNVGGQTGRADLQAAFLTGITLPGGNAFTANGSPGTPPAEMLRLNTAVDAVDRESQSAFGVAGGDTAGFPNGRRPGDDVVDIALRVVMGALCYPLPLDLDGSGTAGDAGDNLGACAPSDAPVGFVPFTDGAPLSAADLDNTFPYLITPYPGSPFDAPLPTPN